MPNNGKTIFQNLSSIMGINKPDAVGNNDLLNTSLPGNEILFATNDKAEYERKLNQYKQEKYLAYQWQRAQVENNMESLASYTAVKLMYRDADLMDGVPEIGTALDIISDEVCNLSSDNQLLKISSKSKRIKSILEDLFYNRLQIATTLRMITRGMVKYGNHYMLLNVTKNGIAGWRQLSVYETDRYEGGLSGYYGGGQMINAGEDLKPDEVRFVHAGMNQATSYSEWQVAHFRLLNDSFFLPYGCIVGDTRIETEDGFKEIDEIEIGDKIWTFDVEKQERVLATVSMAMFKGIKDVYSVKTRHNYIEGTSDHKLLCYDNGKLAYKEICELKEGDLLVIDNSKDKHNKQVIIDKSALTENEANLKKSVRWWTDHINLIPDYVDAEFANFFGFMLGDGWISGNQVFFATGEYTGINKKYADYLEKITGTHVSYRKNKNKINYDFQQACVSSKCLVTILKRMGFAGSFAEKRIPKWLYSCSDDIKKAFLDGLMTADGSYNIDKYNVLRCSIELSNEQLIKDIKVLAQSLGYKSGQICSRNRIGQNRKKLSNGLIINSKTTSYYFYYFETENRQEKKYDLLDRRNGGFKTEKIESIKYAGQKKTYDITVDNENSNFFANGIVTHNCSLLHKARRAWRMWSMMEDAMLIYRLDKSIERRVFKIYVGGINDKDVPAFVQEIANNFKRTPIIDPMTGQVDLRKNFLDVSSDYFIPVRDPSAPNPIETLQAAHNDTSMDDINYMQNKIFAAIRVPKQFINFQDAQGKGQNLSLADIRFARMIMGVQQFVLAELNKVAMVHLYLLGFKEELTNFSLAMNIPTAQIESLELDALGKRIQTAAQALADPGIGMPMVSLHWVQTNILKLSDNEIKDILGEIRLEKAMAAELQATPMIIKKTGMFDAVDNIYGDYEAMNNPQQQQPQQDQGMGGLMGGGGGGLGGGLGGDLGSLGGDMDLDGTPDTMEGGGATGSTDMSSAPAASSGQPLQERKAVKSVIDQYLDMLTEKQKEKEDDSTDGAYVILEQSEKEAKDLDFLIERVENLIKDDEAFKDLGIEDEEGDGSLSGETVSDEDLLNDEE